VADELHLVFLHDNFISSLLRVSFPIFAQFANSPWPMFHVNREYTGAFAQLKPGSPWPMFHFDTMHTGFSQSYTGPSIPRLSWSYKTGDDITYSSAAIGSDGTVLYLMLDYLNCIQSLHFWHSEV
jgi:hypothetical protein